VLRIAYLFNFEALYFSLSLILVLAKAEKMSSGMFENLRAEVTLTR